jgi:hypothetical protein
VNAARQSLTETREPAVSGRLSCFGQFISLAIGYCHTGRKCFLTCYSMINIQYPILKGLRLQSMSEEKTAYLRFSAQYASRAELSVPGGFAVAWMIAAAVNDAINSISAATAARASGVGALRSRR